MIKSIIRGLSPNLFATGFRTSNLPYSLDYIMYINTVKLQLIYCALSKGISWQVGRPYLASEIELYHAFFTPWMLLNVVMDGANIQLMVNSSVA